MKNYPFYKILLLLVTTSAFSQLTVTGNAYVFVKDATYVFVEDDINIASATGNIYLRDDAQLLQGAGTTGNSGVGKLSVYQNGTVDNFAYNYWCSPVGNVDANDNTNRDFIAEKDIYDVTGLTTSTLASYTTGYDGSSTPLVISSYWLYTYDPGTLYSEWDHVGSANGVPTGYGFTMKGTSGSGNNQRYDFRGKPNNGTITTNVLTGEQTLVGNPYPSALDAHDYIWYAPNVAAMTGTLYFWEQDLAPASHYLVDYVGGYASYTISSDGATESFVAAPFSTYNGDGILNTVGSSSTSGKRVYRYLPIAQGFMIEGKANGIVSTTNEMRDYKRQTGTTSEFFRNANTTINDLQYNQDGFQIIPEDYKRFRVDIDFDDVYTRQLLLNFHPTATEGFDYGLESKTPEGLSSDAYWVSDNVPYVTQAHNFNVDLKIPLVVNLTEQKAIRFRILDVQNFDQSQPIFLHDIESDTYVDLREQNYDVNLPAGNFSQRFEITFVDAAALGVVDITDTNFKVIQNNLNAELIVLNPDNLNLQSINLFDVTGKRIFAKQNLQNESQYKFSTKNLSTGVYICKIQFEDSRTISKKLIITN